MSQKQEQSDMSLFPVSKWGEFLHIWDRLQKMPDCILLSLKVGWILALLRYASTNARLYTFGSQSGVNSCTFETGFNKCQIVHFWVSKWGEFLHFWGRLQQMPDCTLLGLKVGWILAHLRQASTNAKLYSFESQSGVIYCTLQNSWPWHVKFLWDLCMHAACRFRHKKIQQIFKSQFLCSLSKLHAMCTKVDEGLPDPYPVPLFLWKGGSIRYT